MSQACRPRRVGWTAAQRAAADAKAAALSSANTVVTKSPSRSGTIQSRYRREKSLDPSSDADHTVDLQLGGTDAMPNMSGLEKSVNRSLGAQISDKIKTLSAGTPVNNVKMEDR